MSRSRRCWRSCPGARRSACSARWGRLRDSSANAGSRRPRTFCGRPSLATWVGWSIGTERSTRRSTAGGGASARSWALLELRERGRDRGVGFPRQEVGEGREASDAPGRAFRARTRARRPARRRMPAVRPVGGISQGNPLDTERSPSRPAHLRKGGLPSRCLEAERELRPFPRGGDVGSGVVGGSRVGGRRSEGELQDEDLAQRVPPRTIRAWKSAFQLEPDPERHLEFGDHAVLDAPAHLVHLEPVDMADRLRGVFDGGFHRLGEAHGRRSDDRDLLVSPRHRLSLLAGASLSGRSPEEAISEAYGVIRRDYPAAATNALGKRAISATAATISRMSTHSPIVCAFCSMPGPMPIMAGCLTAPETTQDFLSGTGIDASSFLTGNPTPSVEKIQRSTRGSLRSAPRSPPAATCGVTTPR